MIELIRTFPSYFVCQNSTSTLASDKEKCDKIIHIFPDICAHSRPNFYHNKVHKIKMYSPIREWGHDFAQYILSITKRIRQK